MESFLTYILKNIVDHPEKVTVTKDTDETGLITFRVTLAEEDMGKVIGKGGKVINAIRQVVKIKSLKTGKRINISLSEPTGNSAPSE